MNRVAQPAAPAQPFAPRVARLRVLHGAKGRRSFDPADPDAMLRELVLVAIDRFDAARRFLDLARGQAAKCSRPERPEAWEALVGHAETDAIEVESALAFLIDAAYNVLAPPALRIAEAEEIARERTAPRAHRFIRRGFVVGSHAYVLIEDVGNMRPGIVARVAADRVEAL